MPEYTLLTVLAIVWGFQIPVHGWLTRLDQAIVRYDDRHFSGVRVFLDPPIEDFGFGFAMVLATLMVWTVLTRRERSSHRTRRPVPAGSPVDHSRDYGGDIVDVGVWTHGVPPAGT